MPLYKEHISDGSERTNIQRNRHHREERSSKINQGYLIVGSEREEADFGACIFLRFLTANMNFRLWVECNVNNL